MTAPAGTRVHWRADLDLLAQLAVGITMAAPIEGKPPVPEVTYRPAGGTPSRIGTVDHIRNDDAAFLAVGVFTEEDQGAALLGAALREAGDEGFPCTVALAGTGDGYSMRFTVVGIDVYPGPDAPPDRRPGVPGRFKLTNDAAPWGSYTGAEAEAIARGIILSVVEDTAAWLEPRQESLRRELEQQIEDLRTRAREAVSVLNGDRECRGGRDDIDAVAQWVARHTMAFILRQPSVPTWHKDGE